MEGCRLVVAKLIVFSQILEGLTCQDAVPGWADSEGRTCQVYVNSNWCTSEGKYGSGWEFNQGERHKNFASFRSGNYTAFQACCGCGAHAQRPTCTEMFPGWVDSDGNSCEDYVSKNWCTATGHYGVGWHLSDRKSFGHYSNQNKSAIQACCGCGADVSSTGCEDQLSGWTDSIGFTCRDYADQNWCSASGYGAGWDFRNWGSFATVANYGFTALEACCLCSAGSSPCMDSDAWFDSDLKTCSSYGQQKWCTIGGGYGTGWDHTNTSFLDLANPWDNTTALEACCVCGGGTTCVDRSGWVDSIGRGCDEYASLCATSIHSTLIQGR